MSFICVDVLDCMWYLQKSNMIIICKEICIVLILYLLILGIMGDSQDICLLFWIHKLVHFLYICIRGLYAHFFIRVLFFGSKLWLYLWWWITNAVNLLFFQRSYLCSSKSPQYFSKTTLSYIVNAKRKTYKFYKNDKNPDKTKCLILPMKQPPS